MHIFSEAFPATVSAQELEEKYTSFSIEDVKVWVETNNGMKGRFQLFETCTANDEFYLKVAKPLLSIGTVGSMTVERRIEYLKHNIMTKKHNWLGELKAAVLFRASEN